MMYFLVWDGCAKSQHDSRSHSNNQLHLIILYKMCNGVVL
jgi:hypothetical protein